MSHTAYTMLPRNPFLDAVASVVDAEIQPGRTVTFLHEVDLSDVQQLRARAAERGERKPSYTALVVKAVALALREFPYANRRVVRWPRRRLQQFHDCDVCVAFEREVPEAPMTAFIDTVRDADRRSLSAITAQMAELAVCNLDSNPRWRLFHWISTRLPSWLGAVLNHLPCLSPSLWVRYRGGAVLVSSPAKYGVDVVAATWTSPLGVSFGLVKDRPMAIDGQVVVRPTFVLTLNFDRRVMAGAQAARFFRRFVEILENAEMEIGEDRETAAPATCTTSPEAC